jgi:hypothetical protein
MSTAWMRFLGEERADGTTAGTLRIAVWVLAALAITGFVGTKVIVPLLGKANTCAAAATGETTANFQLGSQAGC